MKVKTEILFKLWGRIEWLDPYDRKRHFHIPEDEAIFRWASSEGRAELRFKRLIQKSLREKLIYEYPRKLAHIFLHQAEFQKVRTKKIPKIPIQKQLKLFKRPR